MTEKKITINLIQDLATPHNNVLIEQFAGREDVRLNLWYAQSQDLARYQWTSNISEQHFSANIYGTRLNLSFLKYCLAHKDERFVIVGWMNNNTRLLHFLFFLLRRPFNHWTDLPNPKQGGMNFKQRAQRWAAYRLLRFSRCKIFGVGRTTMNHFLALGFPKHMLVNLPIFVSVDDEISVHRARYDELSAHYGVPQGAFLISAGSRLIFEKGYDLLVKAVAELPLELRNNAKLVIVGSGEESTALNSLIHSLGLQHSVHLESWLDMNDFKSLIANSDIFIHPARFDSYGGTIFAMALGVPVIGSTGAGAALDRIVHGVNGFLYEATDTKALAECVAKLLDNSSLRKRIGEAGRETALHWHPSRGVDILVYKSI